MKFELSPGAKVINDGNDPRTINKQSGDARVGLSATRIEGDVKFGDFFDDKPDKEDEVFDTADTDAESTYAPEKYAAPKETLVDLNDTAATALGAPTGASPEKKLAAVLGAMESASSGEYDPYADTDPRFLGGDNPVVRETGNNGSFAVQGHIEGLVYDLDGEKVDPYSSPHFQVGGGGRERSHADTLEELRAALKKMEEKGDNSPPIR